jgi:hypothetical protein
MLSTATLFQGDKLDRQARVADLFAKQAQVYGAWVAANLVLLAALVVLLRRPAAPPAALANESDTDFRTRAA